MFSRLLLQSTEKENPMSLCLCEPREFLKIRYPMGTCVYCYWVGVGTVHVSFIACIYCISFFGGSDDLNESLPRRANLQLGRTADTSGDWRVVSCRLLVAAVLIER